MAVEVKVLAMTLDGLPYGCPACGGGSFTLDGRGLLDALPAWGCCTSYHSWEDQLLTVGDLKMILAARTGRERIEDDDTFEVEVGGAILAGILHPDLTPEDVKAIGRIYWRKIIKPMARRQKNKAIRGTKRAVRRGVTAATKPVADTVATAKAAAIGAAWGLQAGGHEPHPEYTPEPINPCAACGGKGHHDIDTRLHKTTRIRCAVCRGTGEID